MKVAGNGCEKFQTKKKKKNQKNQNRREAAANLGGFVQKSVLWMKMESAVEIDGSVMEGVSTRFYRPEQTPDAACCSALLAC